jgi:hypothetical protein
MLQIIGNVEAKTIAQLILPVIFVILQIDGNTDGQNDTEFGEMQYASFGVFQHKKSGLVVLESAIKSCQSTGMPSEMLVEITIEGEDGNTGRTGGLWKLLEDRVGLGAITVWC